MMKLYRNALFILSLITIMGAAAAKELPEKNTHAPGKSTGKNARQDSWKDSFNVDKKDLGPNGSNTYFILTLGYQQVYKKDRVTLIRTVLKETKIVDGVEVRIVEDREDEDGVLVEVAKDYFAIDQKTNNVYYLGEDVDGYKNGQIANHDSAWLSGVNNARFGMQMPGKIIVGSKYYQELAPGIAMDRFEIVEKGLTVNTPAGKFTNCIKVKETNALEPDTVEYKIYAPGVGMIDDDGMPLVEIKHSN